MAETEYLDQECCPESPAANPKDEIARARRTHAAPRGLQLFNFANPIIQEIEDTDDLKSLFRRWNLVPFAGTTTQSGQMQLYWYLLLAKLSPTHGACISKLLKYAVGTRATFERAVDPEYDIDEDDQELTKPEKIGFREALKEFFVFEGGISKFHRRLGFGYKATGNGWVEMTYVETLGVPRINLRVHRVTDCLYLNTPAGQAREVAISPVWTDTYLNEHNPRIVPLYPNYSRSPGGEVKTMFHLKNGQNAWYGRPDTEAQDLYKYREIQDSIYLIKQAAGNFTGQLIMEYEADDPQYDDEESDAEKSGAASFKERFDDAYTMKGDDPNMVLVLSRAHGAKPMFAFQVKPNTNENWYQVTGEIAKDFIMQGHGVSAQFMGKEGATGLATDIFIGDYTFRNKPTIDDFRNDLTTFTNSIVSAAFKDLLLREDFNDISITFKSPIDKTINDYKEEAKQTLIMSKGVADQNANDQPKPTTEPNNPGKTGAEPKKTPK